MQIGPWFSSPRQLCAALAVVLVAATVLAYLPILENDFVNFDDDKFIYENPLIRSLDAEHLKQVFRTQIFTLNYKPLVYLSWAVEYRLFGLEPVGFHLDNLLLHLINSVLVLLLLGSLAREVEAPERVRLGFAFVGAALFALHPMKVESVAWAVERKDVLFAFFFLSSLLSYVGFCRQRGRTRLYVSAVLFALALLSKGMSITLPAVLFLIDIWFGRRLGWRRLSEKWAFGLVLVVGLWLYGAVQPAGPASAVGASLRYALPEWITVGGYRYFTFLKNLLVPKSLAPLQPVPEWLELAGWPQASLYLAGWGVLALVCLLSWRRTRVVPLSILFYSIVIAPALIPAVTTASLAPDRYSYLPSLGLFAVLAAIPAWLAHRTRRGAVAVGLLTAGYLFSLAVMTTRQVGVWRNSVSLWDHVVATQGELPNALNNRGVAKQTNGDLVGAIKDFDRALEADPSLSTAYNNRGSARWRLGDAHGALEDLDIAVNLEPYNPELWVNRGAIQVDGDDPLGGVESYNRALALAPGSAEIYLSRGVARRNSGLHQDSLADFTRALELGANEEEVLTQRAIARMNLGDFTGALDDNDRVLGISPNNTQVLNNRGLARFYSRDLEGAIADFDLAIRLRSGYWLAHLNRGDARMALQQTEKACTDWRSALDLAGRNVPRIEQRLTEFCDQNSAAAQGQL